MRFGADLSLFPQYKSKENFQETQLRQAVFSLFSAEIKPHFHSVNVLIVPLLSGQSERFRLHRS